MRAPVGVNVRLQQKGDGMGIVDWFRKQTLEGRISRHVGEVTCQSRGLARTRLKIDILEPNKTGGQRIRIGVETTAVLAYNSFGAILTADGAKQLSALLAEAASNK
jgi:hypothetical protein